MDQSCSGPGGRTCSHGCLPAPYTDGAAVMPTCLCPSHFMLSDDNYTCYDPGERIRLIEKIDQLID